MKLRQVREEDCRLLWEWANDPDVRAVSFSTSPISWEDHIQWFTRKRNDPNCFHFIALDDQDIPVGQVRFEVQGEEAKINVSIDKQKRRHGYGQSVIEIATEKMFQDTPVKVVHAYVKPDNIASIRACIYAGFQDLGIEVSHEQPAIHFSRRKGNTATEGGRIMSIPRLNENDPAWIALKKAVAICKAAEVALGEAKAVVDKAEADYLEALRLLRLCKPPQE